MLDLGFTQSKSDYFCLRERERDDSFVALLVYVDDILLATSTDISVVESIKSKSSLNAYFKLKDLGPIKYFLGVEITRSKKGIS